jgi:4-aminobutyrate aminotransferase/(S)-3-amino-2-methylpropionate transaminase
LPFAEQLNPEVVFIDYPAKSEQLDAVLEAARRALAAGRIGAVVVEPVLGRGGCVVPPTSFLPELGALAREAGALVIADEVWTGLGRAGRWLASPSPDFVPDLVCLGKGLGGGLPLSACIGSGAVMAAWRRDEEVVHTSTFAGAPLACATAIATLDALERQRLVERSAEVGARWSAALREALAGRAEVRGVGLMVGVDVGARPGTAVRAGQSVRRAATANETGQMLLERGYIVSSGGGAREVLVLTPPLNIAEDLLDGFVAALRQCLAWGVVGS